MTHDKVLQQMKETITAEPGPVLAYFGPEKEVHMSKKGIGCNHYAERKTGCICFRRKKTRKKCSPLISEYWNHRDEITEADAILLNGEKIIIPHKLRTDMLDYIHTARVYAL